MLTVHNIACTPKHTIGVTDITSTSAVMNVEASDIAALINVLINNRAK